MKTSINKEKLNTRVEASDWRYAAAIVGLIKYFKYFSYCNLHYEVNDSDEDSEEGLEFNSEDITKERYFEFVGYYYSDDLHHKCIEQILSQESYSEAQIKLVNEKLSGNKIMKDTFHKIKFDGTNAEEIVQIINTQNATLTCETYRNKSNMYRNYANTNQLFSEVQDCCRLSGYCIDVGKKGKSMAYNFDTNTYLGIDDQLFDFIPFAFTGDREAFFINDNYNIKQLCKSNRRLEEKVREEEKDIESASSYKDTRKTLFKAIIESSDFIDYDVEVIYKSREVDFFETMYIRKESINILKKIKNYEAFCFSLKVTDKYYINVQKKVTECILNLVLVDELIELFLKEKSGNYMVKRLIEVNVLTKRGGENMIKSMQGAYACAKKVAEKIPENKIVSYRQKLTSAIVFKDYDRVCQILLQLSNYADIPFNFAFNLFEDFEENKELAYTFINSLRKSKEEDN